MAELYAADWLIERLHLTAKHFTSSYWATHARVEIFFVLIVLHDF